MKFLYHLIPHKSNSAVFKIIEYFQTPILLPLYQTLNSHMKILASYWLLQTEP